MFYWHSKSENGNTLKEELFNLSKVSEIRIASAYFSEDGLKILNELKEKYLLRKQNIKLYLSPEFSLNKPYKLLQRLKKICDVYIIFNIKFHPKVYWVKSNYKNKVIFGSSNFTSGGFYNNIEFDMIKEFDKNEEKKLSLFFKYCSDNAKLVNEEIINFYKEKSEEIDKLKNNSKTINKVLYSYERRNDAFKEDDYNLEDMYFKYQDYETLFSRNQPLNNIIINKKRKRIKEKILNIHNKVYPSLSKENIYCHWRSENITSLIRPCEFNFGRVNWIGVRYGKSKFEIDQLNIGAYKNEELGFQKHACLQFCITPNGFEINLFHTVRRDGVDRSYLHEKINEIKSEIIKELDNLKGQGLKWIIYDDINKKSYIFDIDSDISSDFIDFYKKYDNEGRESSLVYYLKPNDNRLKDINSISDVIIEKIKLLLPLYNLISFRIK